jgi:hypothetical protein
VLDFSNVLAMGDTPCDLALQAVSLIEYLEWSGQVRSSPISFDIR